MRELIPKYKALIIEYNEMRHRLKKTEQQVLNLTTRIEDQENVKRQLKV